MHDVHIPHDTKDALKLDEENSNDNWKKVIRVEIQQLKWITIHVLIKALEKMPSDYTKVRCHMIFTGKNDG